MKLEIVEKREEPLLKRKKILAKLSYESTTSSRAEIRNNLASQLGVKEELIYVNKITPHFGSREAEVVAHEYSNEEDVKKVEPEKYQKLNVKKEEPKVEEAKPEASQEKPAEATEQKTEAPAAEETAKEEPKQEATEEKKEEVKEGE